MPGFALGKLGRGLAGAGALAGALGLATAAAAQSDGASYQDWTVQCPSDSACVAMHRQESAAIVAGPNESDGRMRAVVLVAASAGEGTPVAMRLGDGSDVQLLTAACGEESCRAPANPEVVPELLKRLRAADTALIAYPADERIVFTDISLAGLDRALAHVAGE